MDPKATAKSKRSHTQHGRKNQHPPSTIPHKKKSTSEKSTTTSSNRSLPSNWSRYDDEVENSDMGSEGVGDGEVLPKSKGADFGYLIEQARSQPNDCDWSDASKKSSSLDEFSFDFMQGVSSMFSVRGKGLLSLCEDDNFIVDDDHQSSNEIPFLSMDLHALAAQLSKLKLSQRLFVEEDLLPEELTAEESETTSTPKELEISEPSEINHGFDTQALLKSPVSQNDANSQTFCYSTSNDGEMKLEPSKSSEQRGQSTQREEPIMQISSQTASFEAAAAEAELDMLLDSFNDIGVFDSMPANLMNENPSLKTSSLGSEPSKSSEQQEQSTQREVEPIMQISSQTASFEAAAAEAELDMLLDSFNDIGVFDSMPANLMNENPSLKTSSLGSVASKSSQSMSSISPKSSQSMSRDSSLCSFAPKSSQLMSRDPSYSRNVPTMSIDDSIDDLLAETSMCLNDRKHKAPQQKHASFPENSPLNSLCTHNNRALSDTIDDVFAESTSTYLKEQECRTTNERKKGLVSSSKALPPQMMDDFDSWLDSL